MYRIYHFWSRSKLIYLGELFLFNFLESWNYTHSFVFDQVTGQNIFTLGCAVHLVFTCPFYKEKIETNELKDCQWRLNNLLYMTPWHMHHCSLCELLYEVVNFNTVCDKIKKKKITQVKYCTVFQGLGPRISEVLWVMWACALHEFSM